MKCSSLNPIVPRTQNSGTSFDGYKISQPKKETGYKKLEEIKEAKESRCEKLMKYLMNYTF